MDKEGFTQLTCPSCSELFYTNDEYVGVITCPYCGTYVEG